MADGGSDGSDAVSSQFLNKHHTAIPKFTALNHIWLSSCVGFMISKSGTSAPSPFETKFIFASVIFGYPAGNPENLDIGRIPGINNVPDIPYPVSSQKKYPTQP